ncbi:hypothetical protein UFOVP469_18 [uncultured Caudovirales phage]|uniref:Terminase n=1 Tax=uncultured Caudovirales phage TaxID=2100421 RepID=A0A6J5RF56_9CAUD|nr:hypothetical protein UFOVP469_18 [uncultured Caudovirales phage]CAB4190254.1 hypothetical protein UFOVP1200_48 [uncultured Caudovirales phage]
MARRAVVPVPSSVMGDDLVDRIASFRDDPLGFVLFVFPWGEVGTELEGEDGPDDWQRDYLRNLGENMRRRQVEVDLGPYRDATSSGHGIGKTALVSWVILWFMSTRHDAVVRVTANTASQLSTTTWRELSLWHDRMVHADWFEWTNTTFYMKGAAEKWRATAMPWSLEKRNAFAGVHAEHVLLVFDEAAAIADAIWEVAEGATTTAGTVWLAFGNPTEPLGRFRDCFERFAHRWTTRRVDSRQAKKADKATIQQWLEDWGEDSDFFRRRVTGEFPRTGTLQLIGADLVERSQREFRRRFGMDQVKNVIADRGESLRFFQFDEDAALPRLLVVDVARFGADESVVGLRQGKVFVVLARYRDLDGPQLAYRVLEWWKDIGPQAVFIDAVGLGVSCFDTLVDLGYDPVPVNGGVRAMDERTYSNRRTEMWHLMRDWFRDGGMIPFDDDVLARELISPEYGYTARGQTLRMETKDDMRTRGVKSPDAADCLSMSFFMPVAPAFRHELASAKLAERRRNMTRRGSRESGVTWMSR